MRLRNKKTGEIADAIGDCTHGITLRFVKGGDTIFIKSLSELNEEWEDDERKLWWYIDIHLVVKQGELFLFRYADELKEVGNYFETREEAEKAVEKLKAWKRLKDKGFRFERWFGRWLVGGEYNDETRADLDLLFGGEE